MGTELPAPVVVRVTDELERPVAGVLVTFQPPDLGGTWTPASARTDEAGTVASHLILGSHSGAAIGAVSIPDLPAVGVTATALPGPPQALAFDRPPVGGIAGVALSPVVRVTVRDAMGNLVPTATAVIELRLDHGTLLGDAVAEAVSGVAEFPTLHIDETGQDYVLSASSPPLAEAHTDPFDVVSGAALRLEIAGGDGQTGTAGTPTAVRPTVVARDGAGNPVGGAAVRFEVVTGGGAVTPALVTTAADGTAAPDSWVLGEAAGDNDLRAVLEALPEAAVVFAATGEPGPVDAGRSTIASDPDSVAAGDPSTIRVVARDRFGNPVAGASVTLAATGIGNTLTQPPPTDAGGRASGTLTAVTAGVRTVTASIAGVALDGTATLEVTGGVPASISVSPPAVALLQGGTQTLTATVRDIAGAPIDGADVTWKSSRTGVATVDQGGTVQAVAPGSATITATSGSVSAGVAVSVSYGPGMVSGLAYCTMEGVTERMDLYEPEAGFARPRPLVVQVHGGGWVSGSRTGGIWFAPIRERLLAAGYIVVSIDYRLAPEYKWPAQIQDAKCAVRHMRANAARYGADPERIGVLGSSAGGQLVGLLGTTDPLPDFDDVGDFQGVSSRVQATVALSPITDFTATDELRDDYSRVFLTWPDPDSPEMIKASPLTHVTSDDGPFFFVTGEDDTLVLPIQSARMHQRLGDVGVPSTLVTIAHADHGLNATTAPLSPTQDEVISRIVEFFGQWLQ